MSNYYLFQDTRKCIGCHACEVQCKTNKSLPVGPKPCKIIQVGPQVCGGPAAGILYLYALFSLRKALVRGRLSHRRDAKARQ
jgi:ferredoxin